MAGKSNTSATFFAQKKLLGKTHTSNLKTDGEELIGSNIQAASSLIFGQEIPLSASLDLYTIQSASNGGPGSIEYIHFALSALTGTTYDANEDNPDGGSGSDTGESSQASGTHTYKFVFRSDYESNSSNVKKGSGYFDNSKIVHESLGKVQLIPPYFSQQVPNPYIIKIYKDDGSGGIGDEIPLLDNIDWNVDYYNGMLFLQDYNSLKVPAHAKAFAYVGDFANKGFFESGLSGSLTQLPDGSSYLVAGSNITISSASNGAITVAASGGGSVDGSGAATRLTYWSDSDTLTSDADLTFDGTTLTVNKSAIFNEEGGSNDFRIESNNKTHAIFVDGDADQVFILSGSGVTGGDGTDVNIFISGSIDSRGTSTKGTAVFGGDLVVSGTLSVNRSDAGGYSMVTVTTDGKVGIGTDTPSNKLSVGGNMDLGEYLYHKNDADTFIQFSDDEINFQAGAKQMIKLSQAGTNKIILNNGQADVDLQVKSKGNANLFRTDAHNNSVYFGGNGASGADNSFWVSGSIGTRGTSERGTAVFSGDVATSGSIYALNGMSGSLTNLADGSSYIQASGNIAVTTQSNGAVQISTPNYIFNEYLGSASGANTLFALNKSPTANENVSIFVNGQMQMPATAITGAPFQDYSVTGSTIYFTTCSLPDVGSVLLANYTTNDST